MGEEWIFNRLQSLLWGIYELFKILGEIWDLGGATWATIGATLTQTFPNLAPALWSGEYGKKGPKKNFLQKNTKC